MIHMRSLYFLFHILKKVYCTILMNNNNDNKKKKKIK